MKDNKKITDIISDENNLHTRKDFIKNIAVTCTALVMPVSFLSRCSDDGNSDPAQLKTSFEILFSKPMDTASVEAAVSLSPSDPGFLANPVWSDNDTVLRYECDGIITGDYTLTIAETAMSAGGNFLDGNGDGTGGDEYSDGLVF